MSRNGSGTYNLPAGNPVVTGTTITSTWANTSLSDIASALTGSVAADGQTPMSGALNMANNKISAVLDPTSAQDAATKAYTDAAIATATSGLGATYLTKANNLSDVADATTSRTNLVAAKSGANSDITSLTGLTTALTVAQGGTGVTTSTGSGANVLGTSPTIATPTITGNITDGTYTTSVSAAAQGTAKAWVQFDGYTGSVATIQASYNISSVTRNSTGIYTVSFTNAFADTNYNVVTGCLSNDVLGTISTFVIYGNRTTGPATKTTSAIQLAAGSPNSNTYWDNKSLSATFFR